MRMAVILFVALFVAMMMAVTVIVGVPANGHLVTAQSASAFFAHISMILLHCHSGKPDTLRAAAAFHKEAGALTSCRAAPRNCAREVGPVRSG